MENNSEYTYPHGKKSDRTPNDPSIGSPIMNGRRWQISWFKDGNISPNVKIVPHKTKSTEIMSYKEFFK